MIQNILSKAINQHVNFLPISVPCPPAYKHIVYSIGWSYNIKTGVVIVGGDDSQALSKVS